MGYRPRHKLVKAVASLSVKAKTSLILAMAGCATIGAFTLGGTSSASINNGHVITSNGEAGWFTWSGSRFDEVHADVQTTTAAEQSSTTSGPTLGNGVALCTNQGSTADAAQLGEVWNSAEHAFDIVWAEGTLSGVSPNTNGNPCTDGGALPVTISGGATPVVSCTAAGESCGLLSPETNDIPVGNVVYVQIRQWNTHLQFLGEDLSTGLGTSADNEPNLASYPHFAQAGTTFDATGYSAPASNLEANFCWVRASTTTTGEGETSGFYFDNWAAQTVVSTPSGTNADTPLVASTGMNTHVPGGQGCFKMNVGSPTGA